MHKINWDKVFDDLNADCALNARRKIKARVEDQLNTEYKQALSALTCLENALYSKTGLTFISAENARWILKHLNRIGIRK